MHLNKQIKDYKIYSKKEDSILAENYYGYNSKNGKDVFIKIINQKKIPDGTLIRTNLENEIIIHQQLKQKNAKNVLSLIDVAYTQNSIYLIYQNNRYDSLKNYLNYKQMLSEKECINYFIQIYYGYFESYSQKVKYRDITLNNILIGEEDAIRVDDFGLFKTLFYQKNSSLQYRINEAPETQQDRKSYNREKSDSWSLGIILCQLLFLSEPSFQLGQLVLPSSRIISSQMAQLLFSLLQTDPTKRINWVQILSHDCIKNFILSQKQKQDWNLQLSSFLNPSTVNLAERYPQLALNANIYDQTGQNQAQKQQPASKKQNQQQQYPTLNSLNYVDSLNTSKQTQSNQDMFNSKQNVKYPTLSVQPLFNQSAQFKQPIEHMMPGQGDYNGDCLAANFDQFLITANESILRQSVLNSQRESQQFANKNQMQVQQQQNQSSLDQKYPQMQKQNLAPANVNAAQKEDMSSSQQKYPKFSADVNNNRNQQYQPYQNQQFEQQEQQNQLHQYQQQQQQKSYPLQQNTTNSIQQNNQNIYPNNQSIQGMNVPQQTQIFQQQNNLNQQNKYPAMNTNNKNNNNSNMQQNYPQNLNNNNKNNTFNQNTILENNQLNFQTQQQNQLKQQSQIQQQNFSNNQVNQQNIVQNNQYQDQNKTNTQKQQYPQVNLVKQNQQNQYQPQVNLNIKGYQQGSTSLNSISTNQSQEWSFIRSQNDQNQSQQQIAQQKEEEEVDDFNLIQDMGNNNLNSKSIFLAKKKQKIDFISKQKRIQKNDSQKKQKLEQEVQKVEQNKQNEIIEQQIIQENLRLSVTNQNKYPQQQIVEQMDVSKKITEQISQNKIVNNIGGQQADTKQQPQQNQQEPAIQVSRLRGENENQQDEFKGLINDKQIFDMNVRILQEELDKFNVLAQTVERAEDILQAKSNFWVVVSFFILKKLYLIRKELEEQLDAYVKVDESLDRWDEFCLSPEYSKFMDKLRKQNEMIFNSVSSLQKLTIKRLQRLNPQVSNELKKHVPIEETPNYSANFYVHLHFHIISLQESLSKQMKDAQLELLRHITQLQDCLLIVEQGLFVNNEDFFSIQQHNAIQMTPSLEMLQCYSNQKQEKLQMFLMYYRSMGYDL